LARKRLFKISGLPTLPDIAASRECAEKPKKSSEAQRVLFNRTESIGFLPCEKGNSEYNRIQ
jgi:hypothetical protein